MSNSQIEGQLLRTFELALREAVESCDELSWSDMDSIARQKILVNAIRDFDLDHLVTIGWYKNGDVLTELENYESKTILTNAGADVGPIPSQDAIVDHITDPDNPLSVQRVLGAESRKEWLKEYYESHEDMPFDEIYLRVVEIHLLLKEITELCSENAESNRFPSEMANRINEEVDELKSLVRNHQLFRNTAPYLTEFRIISAEIMQEFESRLYDGIDDLSSYASLFSQLNKFYYETVWNVIANRIEYYTVEGPNEEVVRAYREGTLHVSKQTFSSELDKLREQCRRVDIGINPRLERIPDLSNEYGDLQTLLEEEYPESTESEA